METTYHVGEYFLFLEFQYFPSSYTILRAKNDGHAIMVLHQCKKAASAYVSVVSIENILNIDPKFASTSKR